VFSLWGRPGGLPHKENPLFSGWQADVPSRLAHLFSPAWARFVRAPAARPTPVLRRPAANARINYRIPDRPAPCAVRYRTEPYAICAVSHGTRRRPEAYYFLKALTSPELRLRVIPVLRRARGTVLERSTPGTAPSALRFPPRCRLTTASSRSSRVCPSRSR